MAAGCGSCTISGTHGLNCKKFPYGKLRRGRKAIIGNDTTTVLDWEGRK